MTERQLAAVYAALLATEAVTEIAPVTVGTMYPFAGWVGDWMARPPSGQLRRPHQLSGTAKTPTSAAKEYSVH